MFDVPSRKDVERVVITPEVVNKEASPKYVLKGAGPKRSKNKTSDTDEEKSA